MSFDYNKIKEGFKLYLTELNEKKGKNINDDLSLKNDASIFLNSNEFKNYLSSEYDVDASVMSKSVNEILKMDIVDGKLVDIEDLEDAVDMENGDFVPVSDNTEEGNDAAPVEGEEEAAPAEEGEVKPDSAEETDETTELANLSLTDVINGILEDEDVKTAIDSDGDGELSTEEIQSFLGAASTLDGSEDELSLQDLFAATEIIKDNEWNVEEEDISDIAGDDEVDNGKTTNDKKEEITGPANAGGTASTGGTGSVGGSSGGGYVGGSSGGGSSSSPVNSTPVEKTIENMTADELKVELSEREKDLSTKQKELSEASSGETQELKDKQEAIDKAYEKYQEEVENVDKELAKELDDKKTEIDDKKQEIADKENEISENECKVSDAETAVSNAKATISSINSAISAVNDALSGDISDEQKSSYNEKLSSLKAQLSEAESAKTKAEEQLDEAKEALETSKEEKATLEDELETLNDEMTEIEDKILEANPKIKEYMDAYKEAQEDFDTAKADAISKAQEAVQVAQESVIEVQNKLNEVQNKAIEASVGGEYNAEAGQRLAQNALNVDGTTGLCLGGVSKTLTATYGEGLPGLGSAYKAAEALRGNTPGYEGIASHFVEKTDYTVDDLPNLPAGAIIVWENNGPGGLSQEHGHISISLGDGRESSDHIQKQIQCPRNFTVFLPVS